ncbi:MAG TPA: flagellar hook-length control protein FliK [Trinickia sp.]|nr:flagellar hook-length control protein FliK [Trinickia sp.]
MTGIDSALASMLVSRIDSLLDGVAAGSRTSPAQSGATGLTVDTPLPADGAAALADTPPPASAQAVLSEVALTLDAISRFGGDATPAVIGEAPIWHSPPAIDTPGGLFSADANATAAAAAGAHDGANPAASAPTGAAAGTAALGAAATAMPVEALAQALAKTVDESGLFYESHLAQWLSGAYPADALANEPQTRLAAEAIQLPLDWSDGEGQAGGNGAPAWAGSNGPIPAGGGWLPHELPPQLSLPAFGAGQHAGAASGYPNAAADGAAWRGAHGGALDDPSFGAAGGARSNALEPDVRASIAASIHTATIPLVRQQLDVLATQQFRWTGEVWPGAKLDWTIEPERERRGPGGEGNGEDPQQAWRTRVTLALPTLGTVDADLVLTGNQLVVRVQASPGGAARLSSGGAAFGARLQAAGIELAGLQIREIGGAAPAAAGSAASSATSAYARAAAEALDAEVRETPRGTAPFDGQGAAGAHSGETDAKAARGSVPSPIDRLFEDPFEWSGS